tara:strand:+ start:68 stop:823 length:756 start_codon:yes stop_codon:yes gene_type:complete
MEDKSKNEEQEENSKTPKLGLRTGQERGRMFIQELKDDLFKIAEKNGEKPNEISDRFLKAIAEISSVDYRTLRKWLNGTNDELTDATYNKLVDVFKNVRTERVENAAQLNEIASDIGVDALDFEVRTSEDNFLSDENENLIGSIYDAIVGIHKTCRKSLRPQSSNFEKDFKKRLTISKKIQESAKEIFAACKQDNIYLYSALLPIWNQPSPEIFNLGEERTIRLRVYFISLVELNNDERIFPVDWNRYESI